ncbi:MAG: hypothetical protein U0441_34215 [Polyangiaceae bacterium]
MKQWSKVQVVGVLIALFAGAGCDGQEVNSGSSNGGGGGTSTTSSGGTGGTGGGTDTGGTQVGLADVLLSYGGSSVTVDVATLDTQMYKGAAVVPLTAVWAAGKLHDDTTTLQFDFEGDDGFHPSNKANCAAYITDAELPKGYILPDTRTLVWDDTLGLPGCYSVKAVAKIIGLDKK